VSGEIEPPRRERVILLQCRCLLIHAGDSYDRCPAIIGNPDEPFCPGCTEHHQIEHPALPPTTVVTAVPVQGMARPGEPR
jgi:hypothetical protein